MIFFSFHKDYIRMDVLSNFGFSVLGTEKGQENMKSSDERPNLLYIHTDQHTPFVLGCYGDSLVQTPHLDQLAAQGMVFDAVYCTSPICVPSRMSMLTGLHPFQNEVWTNEHILNSGLPTLAHALGAAGYVPVLAGRMHALGPDQLHGYAERTVGDHSPNYPGGPPPARGALDGTNMPDRISLQRSGSGQSPYEVHDEEVTAEAVKYLNHYAAQKKSGGEQKPFCLTVGYMLPHAPYVARSEAFRYYDERMIPPQITQIPNHPFFDWWREHTQITDVTEEEIHRARAAYWALVTSVDAMIGQILNTLRANDLAENTLIVYTSDHGDMVGEHGLWWKHTFYEHSVRVPLIISWLGKVPAGARNSHVVSALDVTATILDAMNAPTLPGSAGRSLLPMLSNETNTWEDVTFSEYCSDQFCPGDGCYQRMIRMGPWKLIYYHEQPSQLFNLDDDPQELNDLSQVAEYEALKTELTECVLADWDPEKIKAQMALMRERTQVMKGWVKSVQPPETHRWSMTSEMSYLD